MNGIPKKIKIYVNKKIKNNNFVYSSKSKTKKKQSNFDLYILDNNFDKCFVKIEKMGLFLFCWILMNKQNYYFLFFYLHIF
jgi:hypothetical protein